MLPILNVITLVNVDVDSNSEPGICGAFPITICTASASPKARAIPSTTPVNKDGIVVGSTVRYKVCQRVAPSAYDPSFNPEGSAANASVAIDVIVGRIMIDSTVAPAAIPRPCPGNRSLYNGTITLKPTKP
ncbi:hypothetical protein D3C81_1144200 [compost metagenome]